MSAYTTATSDPWFDPSSTTTATVRVRSVHKTPVGTITVYQRMDGNSATATVTWLPPLGPTKREASQRQMAEHIRLTRYAFRKPTPPARRHQQPKLRHVR